MSDAAERRILIHGVTGSGKSTAAVRIAQRLGVPAVLADDIGWLPGWVQRDPEEQLALVDAATARDGWVLDSSYSSWRDLVLPRVDLILGLDYPRWFSLQRLLRRTARRIRTREEICNGNRESLGRAFARDSIVAWHFQTWKAKRETMRRWAADPTMPQTILFRTPRELDRWIEALPARASVDS
ncbi:P-loop NTPase family protein [Gryllotalpicola ginsengisoli]|uniref:hypothetical protein n=1 Tax=Gryllotalpicola ginsengisoli TaxID=444608 RepID=UPI000409CD01|nr:hypothetical protein [Gryllotalpicola ginsengisoli]